MESGGESGDLGCSSPPEAVRYQRPRSTGHAVRVGEGLMVVPAHADVVVVDMVSGAQQWRATALPPEVAAGTVNGFLNNATVTGDTVAVAASNESGV